jgi:hypothetical protein
VFWDAVLKDLQGRMTRATFDQLLRGSKLTDLKLAEGDEPASLTVQAFYAHGVPWLENRFKSLVERVVGWQMGQPARVAFQAR